MKRIINFAVIMMIFVCGIDSASGFMETPPYPRAKVMPRMQRDKAKAAAIKNREYQPTDAQLMAAERFREEYTEARITWSAWNSSLGKIEAINTEPKPDKKPDEVAMEFLQKNSDFFQINVDDLKLVQNLKKWKWGTTKTLHLDYVQYYQGIPIGDPYGGAMAFT